MSRAASEPETPAPGGQAGPQRWSRAAIAAASLFGLAALPALSLLLDTRLELRARSLPPDAVAWGRFVSTFAKSVPLYLTSSLLTLGALLLRSLQRLRAAAAALTRVAERAGYVLATLAASTAAAQAVKHTIGRARPRFFATLGPYHFDGPSADDGFASFPSGHSTTAFAMATALSLLFPGLRVALFTLATAIAASRVVVQAHYFSDVAAGAALGCASAVLVAQLFARADLMVRRRPGRPAAKPDASTPAPP